MTTLSTKYWSDAELLALPKDGSSREIIHGELHMSPASADHGSIIAEILSHVALFARTHKLGKVFDGQTGCRMQSGDLFSPDISFVSAHRWKIHRAGNSSFFQGAPDLAIEVLSPGDTVAYIEEKIHQYFNNGSRLAWVISPVTKSATVYRSPTPDRIIKPDGLLLGEDVLPGFSLPLLEVFDD